MKSPKFWFKALAASIMLVSCNVDDSYDLSDINSDNVGIGTDESQFDLPLATISLALEELGTELTVTKAPNIAPNSVESILDVINSVTALLPNGTIDITRLTTDGADYNEAAKRAYVTELVDSLEKELKKSYDKREELIAALVENVDYYKEELNSLCEDLGIDFTTDDANVEELAKEFGDVLNDVNYKTHIETFKQEIINFVMKETQNFTSDFEVEADVDEVKLDQDVLDMLSKNLDGENNTIQLFASINTDLDLGFSIIPYITYGNNITLNLSTLLDPTKNQGLDYDTIVEILKGFTVNARVAISEYDSTNGALNYSGKNIYIKVFLRKNGSLVL